MGRVMRRMLHCQTLATNQAERHAAAPRSPSGNRRTSSKSLSRTLMRGSASCPSRSSVNLRHRCGLQLVASGCAGRRCRACIGSRQLSQAQLNRQASPRPCSAQWTDASPSLADEETTTVTTARTIAQLAGIAKTLLFAIYDRNLKPERHLWGMRGRATSNRWSECSMSCTASSTCVRPKVPSSLRSRILR